MFLHFNLNCKNVLHYGTEGGTILEYIYIVVHLIQLNIAFSTVLKNNTHQM